ncbi:MAG TPA: hypothetical protein VGM05_24375 [Planctomycetaceae bacterium]
MKIRVAAGFAVAVSLGLTALWAIAQVKEVLPEELPAKVSAAAKAKWPKARTVHAFAQEDEGKTVYNLELSEGAGKQKKKWGARFSADGKFVELQESANLADIPKPVLAALAKKYPLIKKAKVEKITEGEGATAKTAYEFRFLTHIRIDAAGKTLDEVEVELDEGSEE